MAFPLIADHAEQRLVASVDPSMFTPRNVMQLCSASITTPAPCGSRMSWMASAISARATDHRQHVMLTKADHADVPNSS
jgi:hypothetical protein